MYYPVMCLARFNLYLQSLLLLFSRNNGACAPPPPPPRLPRSRVPVPAQACCARPWRW